MGVGVGFGVTWPTTVFMLSVFSLGILSLQRNICKSVQYCLLATQYHFLPPVYAFLCPAGAGSQEATVLRIPASLGEELVLRSGERERSINHGIVLSAAEVGVCASAYRRFWSRLRRFLCVGTEDSGVLWFQQLPST